MGVLGWLNSSVSSFTKIGSPLFKILAKESEEKAKEVARRDVAIMALPERLVFTPPEELKINYGRSNQQLNFSWIYGCSLS